MSKPDLKRLQIWVPAPVIKKLDKLREKAADQSLSAYLRRVIVQHVQDAKEK